MIGYGIPTYPQQTNNANVMLNSLDKQIENQEGRLNELKQMKNQLLQPQQPSISQTFQLAPNNTGIKYVETMEDVSKEMIFTDTPFFSKDMSVLWIKNIKGEIKSYSLTEIIQKDEKDIQIEYLMSEIEKLKKGNKENEEYGSVNDIKPTKEQKSSSISVSSKSK